MSPFGRFKPALVGSLVLLLAACDGGVSPNLDGGSDGGSDAGPSFRLSGLPDCGTVADGGTVSDLYDVSMSFGCGASGCHGTGPGSQLFDFSDAAGFRDTQSNVKSTQVPELNRITPGDIHASYTVYKLVGQHRDAGFEGLGDRMPQGGPYLDDLSLCRVLNWVSGGAR
jgi:hypothetical protein